MAYGTAPGQTLKDDWDVVDGGGSRYNPHINRLVQYFRYHPHVKFGNSRLDQKEMGALRASIKRLRNVYPDVEIRRAIDRFYMMPVSVKSKSPAFSFCSKKLQEKLFEGADVVHEIDIVMEWMANGFERPVGMRLPWDGEFDHEVSMEFILTPEFNVLARTYPEVVASILNTWWDGSEWLDMMDGACVQYQWLLGVQDEPSNAIVAMSEEFDLPKDFLTRDQPRKTQDTVQEAVRIAHG